MSILYYSQNINRLSFYALKSHPFMAHHKTSRPVFFRVSFEKTNLLNSRPHLIPPNHLFPSHILYLVYPKYGRYPSNPVYQHRWVNHESFPKIDGCNLLKYLSIPIEYRIPTSMGQPRILSQIRGVYHTNPQLIYLVEL